MIAPAAVLPIGYRVQHWAELGSTNSHALALAAVGEPSGLWILADAQTQGRGRAGRTWASRSGNFHASLLLRLGEPLSVVQNLSLLVPVAVHDAIARAAGEKLPPASLRLKWPNDVLIGTAKTAGILIESTGAATAGGLAVIVGVGVNLSYHPTGIDQRATNLAQHGITITNAEMLTSLAETLDHWLALWDHGRAFATIREAWIERAGAAGEPISVRDGDRRVAGRYLGLDETGALLLEDEAGRRLVFHNGQVALGVQRR